MAQKKPLHKTFTFTLFLENGKTYTHSYTTGGMVGLLEFVKGYLGDYNVKSWRIDNVKHNY